MSTTYSKTLIKEWSDYHQVGIWDNCKWSVRLYEDRVIYKDYTVKWINNTGSLATQHERFTGVILEALKKIAAEEIADNADYIQRVYELVNGDY